MRSKFQLQGPRLSPDSRAMAFTSNQSGRTEVYAAPFDPAAAPGASASIVPTQVSDQGGAGMVFWNRNGKEIFYLAADRAVMAVAVEGTAPVKFGKPRVLFRPSPDIAPGLAPGTSNVSRDGERFVFAVPRPQLRQLTVYDRQGKAVATAGQPGSYVQPNLSPDGTRAVVMRNDPRTGNDDIWVIDLATGNGTAITNDVYPDNAPIWSPDGKHVAYVSTREGLAGIYRKAADGSGEAELLFQYTPGAGMVLTDWSPDGKFVTFYTGVIVLVPVGTPGDAKSRKEIDWLREDYEAGQGRFSPDNRYIAYDAPEREGAAERDIIILDAHTGKSWPLEAVPGDDVGPHWTPDGQALVFVSDRNRNSSLWMAPLEQGRLSGPPQLLRDGVGRISLHGFTADGALHYLLAAGFAEVYLASIDGTAPRPEPLSPHRAVSNFYPKWSNDGRFVAYGAEVREGNAARSTRELWVFDSSTGTEARVPFDVPVGLPIAWSVDSHEILVGTPSGLYIVDRVTGRFRQIASDQEGRKAWGPGGILLSRNKNVVLVDPASGRTVRTIGPQQDVSVSPDGRSIVLKRPNGTLAAIDPSSGANREWTDPVEWVGLHFVAPHTPGVAYLAARKSVGGDFRSLMYWPGGGDPRELLRIDDKERFILAGWLPDGQNLLAARGENRLNRQLGEPDLLTLWRIPITGGSPASTGLTMDGLRDISIHPDGRRIAFNAGWRRFERWVMEHVLPQ
jgi:Tol biopolymer transport system component